MEIQRIEVYRLYGKEYRSIKDIQTDIENKIGRIIDSFDVTLTPKQRLNILAGMVKNKMEIVKLLSVEIDQSDDPMYRNMENILDI